MKKLILMTGIPGSGKSYLAKKLAKNYDNSVILSTDDFFMKDGTYQWSGAFISDAHKWNQGRCFLEMFKETQCIIIDNTNLQAWQMYVYVDAAVRHGYEWEIVESKTAWAKDPAECAARNTHGVDISTIQNMLAKAESVKDMNTELKNKFNGKK